MQETGFARVLVFRFCSIFFWLRAQNLPTKYQKPKTKNEQPKHAQVTAEATAATAATNAPYTRRPDGREKDIHEKYAVDASQ